ncbi:ribokinase [Streptomyces sp. NPDC059697]|uniref:ribokinase n=1 Tax=Streptomyces sp. NPDC059697 TaxID=3346912 RepID=UPI0036979AFC
MTHIAVLGSTNMDLLAYVAKAPQRGETVTGREFRTIPGGKGANQAVAAAHAGADVSMIGAVGADAFGSQLRTTLELPQALGFARAGGTPMGVDTDHLRTTEGPSGTAHIVVDDEGGNEIVVIPGANGTVDHLAPGDEALITSADALLQLEIPLAAVLAGAEAARRHGVRTILTPSPVQSLPPELLASIDLLVPNEHEAAALTGLTDPGDAATALLDQVPEVVVTLGAAGSLYATRGAEPLAVPAPRVTAVDSTGAGDTFVGTLAVALAEGRPMRAALAWASTAASLSAQRAGASSSMPYRSEIDAQAASNTRYTS